MLCRIVGRGVASLGLISAVALLTVSGCTGSPNPGGDPSPLDPVTNGLIVNGYVNVTTDPNEPNQPAAYSTQQYEFNADPISGSRPLTVTCAVSTITGDPLASGTYAWKFDGVEESGPMAEYAQRSHVFQTGGAHTIALAVSLLGVSAPISCTSKQTRTTQCVVVVAPRISGHVLDASGQGISGVVVAGNAGAGTAVSATDGAYEIEVPYNWSGQIGPQNSTLIFQQSTRSYSNAKQDLTGQDFSVAAAAKVKIAGSIHDSSGNPLAGVALAADNSGGSATTGADGSYQFELTGGWSGKITPTLKDFAFTPSDRSYSNLTADAQSQDFAGNSTVPATVKIAGCVKDPNGAGISGVPVVASNGGPSGTTDANGRYELTVAYHWNGTITPSNESYTFVPSSRPYADATANLSSEDFTATPVLLVFPKVSGYVKDAENRPVQGVTLTATSSEARATTDANGFYEMTMTINWSGKITPALGEYGFEPAFIEYTALSTNLTQQNYKAMAPAPVGSRTISGVCKDALGTGLVGIVLTASTGETAASGPNGAYALSLSEGWSGTITTPPFSGDPNYSISPANRAYDTLSSDSTDQDFVICRNSKTSTTIWQNFSIAAQTGTFTVEFNAVPSAANMDGVIAMSQGAKTAYSAFAALVRFNSSGSIDAYNGTGYQGSVAYVAGKAYHFKLTLNVTTQKYDVSVTPAGGSVQSLGTGLSFRTSVTDLDNWGIIAAVGLLQVSDLLVANAGPDKTVAPGGSTTLDGSATDGGTYTWSPATGLSSTTDAKPTATPSATTEYTLTVKDSLNSTAMDKVVVTVQATPFAANAGADKTVAPGGSTLLDGSATGGTAPYTYTWSPATGLSSTTVAQPTATPSATTTYTLTVKDSLNNTATDTMVVTVQASTGTNAIAVWGIHDKWPMSGAVNVRVAAYHETGIKSVAFQFGGAASKFSKTVTDELLDPTTAPADEPNHPGFPYFFVSVDTTQVADGDYTLTATATPNAGVARALPSMVFRIRNAPDVVRYVDNVNGDDSFDGTARTRLSATQGPWRSLAKAASAATESSGISKIVLIGSAQPYSLSGNALGSPSRSSYLKWVAAEATTPIIATAANYIAVTPYTYLEGLSLEHNAPPESTTRYFLDIRNSHHIVLRRCSLYRSAQDIDKQSFFGIYAFNVHFLAIIECSLHEWGTALVTTNSPMDNALRNLIVRNTKFYHSMGSMAMEGISGALIEGSKSYDMANVDSEDHADNIQFGMGGQSWNENTIIRNVSLWNSGHRPDGTDFLLTGRSYHANGMPVDVAIYNCWAKVRTATNFLFNMGFADHVCLVNNTIWRDEQAFGLVASNEWKNSVILNNLTLNLNGLDTLAGGTNRIDANVYELPQWQKSTWGSNDVVDSSPITPDLRLLPGSRYRYDGEAPGVSTNVKYDFQGTPRHSSAPSRGAFED